MSETESSARPDWSALVPIAVGEVELSQAISAPASHDALGAAHGAAQLLVRLHAQPLGVARILPGNDGFTPATCADAIWSQLGDEINAHLQADGLQTVGSLSTAGLGEDHDDTPCQRGRHAADNAAPLVSVIVCTKDRPQLLVRTLESLADLTYPNYETLVIDGSGGDGTERLVRDEFPEVRYHRLPGGALIVGRNRGIAEAIGSIVAFTDDDAVVDRYWLGEHVASLLADENVACSTGPAFPLELKTAAQVWFEEFGSFAYGLSTRTLSLATRAPGSLLPFATGRIGSGVNMVWRTEVIRALEFDPALDAIGAEDLASFFDALCAGHAITFTPGALLWHEHRRDYDGLKRQLASYARGLGAYLFRSLLKQPQLAGEFVLRLPNGLRYAFGSGSARHDQQSTGFPRELHALQYSGLMKGPGAYLRGLRMVRTRRRWAAKRSRSA